MKKAEIIKNGNVNLNVVKLNKKVKKEIDWNDLELDYVLWVNDCRRIGVGNPHPHLCFEWFRNKLS